MKNILCRVGCLLKTRSSSQRRSDSSTTTHIVFNVWPLILGFGESCTIAHDISQICSIDTFRLSLNLKGDFSTSGFGVSRDTVSRTGPFDSQPIGHGFPVDPNSLSLTAIRYLADSKSVSARPFDPYTMTITALESILLRRAAKIIS